MKSEKSLRAIQAEVIHPGTTAALRSLWLAQGRPTSSPVICDAGEPLAPDHFSARFRALCESAGVPVLRSIHNVRHTLATALKLAGVPDHRATAALLGQEVQTFQRFYLVTDDEGAAEAAEVAERLFAV